MATRAQVLPTAPMSVVVMVRLAGVTVVDDWEDIAHSRWGTVLIAVKTHWLPQIAMEMEGAEVRARSRAYAVARSLTHSLARLAAGDGGRRARACRARLPESWRRWRG